MNRHHIRGSQSEASQRIYGVVRENVWPHFAHGVDRLV